MTKKPRLVEIKELLVLNKEPPVQSKIIYTYTPKKSEKNEKS